MVQECFTIAEDAPVGVFEVKLHGDVDLARGEELRRLIALFARSMASDLVIDLREVTVLDPMGLAALLDLRREAMVRGCAMTLCNPAPVTRRVIDVAGLSESFDTDPAPPGTGGGDTA